LRNVNLVYRPEGPGWVATSPEAPDYIAYAGSLAEAVQLAHEGIAFHLDVDESLLSFTDLVNSPPGLVVANNSTAVSGNAARSGAFAVGLNVGETVVPTGAPASIAETVRADIRITAGSAA
jgi:predicted RNase H-like HicB family nuclease